MPVSARIGVLESPVETLDDWINNARFESLDGLRIACWTAGSGRPLVLVHGYPTASWDWHHLWPELSASRSLVACDMMGFGLSDKPSSGYSIHRQADIHEALLAALGIDDYDILAHDYGVSVAQELLARQQEGNGAAHIGRIVFLNGGLFAEQHRALPIQKLGASPLGFLVGLFMNRDRFGRAFSQVFGSATRPTPQELDEHWRLISTNNGHRIAHRLLHYIDDRRRYRDRWVAALQESPIPLQLVNGGADRVSGRHLYDYFREMVPQADAVCFDDIGHYPQLEAPDRVLAEIGPFLAQRGV